MTNATPIAEIPTCPHDGTPLRRARVLYGLVDWDDVAANPERYKDVIFGGCCVMPGADEGWLCPECGHAEYPFKSPDDPAW